MDTERAKARLGATLKGRYRLDAVIGVGGMAVVYRGAHRNGNRVAVKVLHPELSVIDDLRVRFLKEGYVANAVDHPGAVRVLDDDITEDGQVFLVMELLEGETLEHLWRDAPDRRIPTKDVVEHTMQVLATLAAAHQQQIVHRDIKPENLFLTRAGQVKVLDFGIARVRAANAESLTRTGRMLGTPAYMPPEQALGITKEIDGRTDLWALGASMFTMMTGAFVHPAETLESMLVFTATRPARPIASVMGDIPAPVAEVIDRALAFTKHDRFADAAAMLAALDEAHRLAFGAGSIRNVIRVDAGRMSGQVHAVTLQAAMTRPANPSPLGLAAASTTAGVTSERRPTAPPPAAVHAVTPPLITSPGPPPRTGPTALMVLAAIAAGGLVALAGFGVASRSTLLGGSPPESMVDSSVAPPLAAATSRPSAPPAVVVETPPAVAESTVAVVASASAAPSAKTLASPPPPPLPRVVVKRPAEPDCSPPFFFDAAGNKKVKPGC